MSAKFLLRVSTAMSLSLLALAHLNSNRAREREEKKLAKVYFLVWDLRSGFLKAEAFADDADKNTIIRARHLVDYLVLYHLVDFLVPLSFGQLYSVIKYGQFFW